MQRSRILLEFSLPTTIESIETSGSHQKTIETNKLIFRQTSEKLLLLNDYASMWKSRKTRGESFMRRKLAIFLAVLMVVSLMPLFSQATVEKANAYDAIVAEQEASKSGSVIAEKSDAPILIPGGSIVGTNTSRPSVSGKQIVGAGHPRAAMAGYKILEAGGTAFDAALAIAGLQSIMEPYMTNILGGDAEILVWDAAQKKATVYNGTGWAPKNATIDFYLDLGGIPQQGPLSMHMPGAWAGWMKMLENHGTLPLEEILAPVIETSDGYLVDETFVNYLGYFVEWVGISEKVANKEFLDIYAKNDQMKNLGDVIENKNLSKTLRELSNAAKRGKTLSEGYKLASEYFYRGPIAEKIVKWSKANGGLFELEDFTKFYAEVQEPWSTNYKGYDILVCPPNSQGPALLEALNIIENYDLTKFEHNSAEYIDLLTQVLNIALLDRNNFNGDPRFVDIPKEIISKEYAKERTKDIHLGSPMEFIPTGPLFQSFDGDTTFMYVADKWGNVVVSTHSLNNVYGSYQVIGDTGILMNNRLVYYVLDDTIRNSLEPHKRTIQTITPSIGLKDGKPDFIVGTPGGDNQEQEKLQVILNYIDFGMKIPQAAIEAPRMTTGHPPGLFSPNSFPKVINLEIDRTPNDVLLTLENMGYKIGIGSGMSIGFARLFDNGFMWGGYDPRMNGYAVAW